MRLAIFDIDGTIFRSSLVIQLCEALVREKIFPKSSTSEIQKEYLAWLDRKGSYEAYINKVVKIYIKHIKGKRFTKVKRVADRVIKEQKNRTYRFTRNLIAELKYKKYYLVAVSGSPDYIVESYAKAIGFNACFGTRLEVLSDKFTGKVVNLDSAFNKAKVVKGLARELFSSAKKTNSYKNDGRHFCKTSKIWSGLEKFGGRWRHRRRRRRVIFSGQTHCF
jgi:HAD superfamily phosphoserine phosphatase-like hydrolase